MINFSLDSGEKMEKRIIIFIVLLLSQVVFTLTNGPVQQEYQNFSIGKTNVENMVNPATGDFTYSIPLGEARTPAGSGYAFSLNYSGGIKYEQEATWVGLGWSLNVGEINRQISGFPDDYNADHVSVFVKDGIVLEVNDDKSRSGDDLTPATSKKYFLIRDLIGYGHPGVREGTSNSGLDYSRSGGSSNIDKKIGSGFDLSALGELKDNNTNLIKEYATGYLNASAKNAKTVETEDPVLLPFLGSYLNRSGDWEYNKGVYAYERTNPLTTSPAVKTYFDASEFGEYSLGSQDLYTVNANGIGGSFKPFSYTPNRAFQSDDKKLNALIGELVGEQIPAENYWNTFEARFGNEFSEGYTFKFLNEKSFPLIDNSEDLEKYEGMDAYTTPSTRAAGSQIVPLFNDEEKLSGFIITTTSGMRYYFTKPLYSYQTISYSTKTLPETVNGFPVKSDESGEYGKTDFDGSFREDLGTHAKTWLLTAITGPDYLKTTLDPSWTIEEMLLPHQGDGGYWVSFRYEYGTSDEQTGIIDKGLYAWRSPYGVAGDVESWFDVEGVEDEDEDNTSEETLKNKIFSTQFGLREITYLKSIETATDFLNFHTSDRLDGKGVAHADYPKTGNSKWDWNTFDSENGTRKIQKVKVLDSISFYSKSSYPELSIVPVGTAKPIVDLINKEAFKKVKFNYDYILAQGTPNSNGIYPDPDESEENKNKVNTMKGGRLTLLDVQLVGTKDFAVNKYHFGYQLPSVPYKKAAEVDYWGFCKDIKDLSEGATPYIPIAPLVAPKTPFSKTTSQLQGGLCWNLNTIITPQNNLIRVNLERDEVAGLTGTFVHMDRNNDVDPLAPDVPRDYSTGFDVTSYDGDRTITVELNPTEVKGDYLVAKFTAPVSLSEGVDIQLSNYFYSYQILDIDAANTSIILDRKIDFAGYNDNVAAVLNVDLDGDGSNDNAAVFSNIHLDSIFILTNDYSEVIGEGTRVKSIDVISNASYDNEKSYMKEYLYNVHSIKNADGYGGIIGTLPGLNFPPKNFTTGNLNELAPSNLSNLTSFMRTYDFSKYLDRSYIKINEKEYLFHTNKYSQIIGKESVNLDPNYQHLFFGTVSFSGAFKNGEIKIGDNFISTSIPILEGKVHCNGLEFIDDEYDLCDANWQTRRSRKKPSFYEVRSNMILKVEKSLFNKDNYPISHDILELDPVTEPTSDEDKEFGDWYEDQNYKEIILENYQIPDDKELRIEEVARLYREHNEYEDCWEVIYTGKLKKTSFEHEYDYGESAKKVGYYDDDMELHLKAGDFSDLKIYSGIVPLGLSGDKESFIGYDLTAVENTDHDYFRHPNQIGVLVDTLEDQVDGGGGILKIRNIYLNCWKDKSYFNISRGLVSNRIDVTKSEFYPIFASLPKFNGGDNLSFVETITFPTFDNTKAFAEQNFYNVEIEYIANGDDITGDFTFSDKISQFSRSFNNLSTFYKEPAKDGSLLQKMKFAIPFLYDKQIVDNYSKMVIENVLFNEKGFSIEFKGSGHVYIKSITIKNASSAKKLTYPINTKTYANNPFTNLHRLTTNRALSSLVYPKTEILTKNIPLIDGIEPEEIMGRTVSTFVTCNTDLESAEDKIKKPFFIGISDDKKILTVEDKTGIIGSPLTTSFYKKGDLSSEPIKQITYNYAFGPELNNEAGTVNGDGSSLNSADSKNTLGIIRERMICKKLDATSYVDKTISDCITYQPFLHKKSETLFGVTNTTENLLYNIVSGAPLTQKKSGVDPDATVPVLSSEIPLESVVASDDPILTAFKKKNIITPQIGAVVSEANASISNLSDIYVTALKSDAVLKAEGQTFSVNDDADRLGHFEYVPNFTQLKDQQRLVPEAAYTWLGNGTAFKWFTLDETSWRKSSQVIARDTYLRPLQTQSSEGIENTIVYHPYLKGVVATITNANRGEASVFSADYDDADVAYYDFANKWEKGSGAHGLVSLPLIESVGTDDEKVLLKRLGGKSALRIRSGIGVKRTFAINPGEKYHLSALVAKEPGTEETPIVATCAYIVTYGNWDATGLFAPNSEASVIPIEGISSFIQRSKTTITAPANATAVLVEIGTADGTASNTYLNDIRFYPADAVVRSFAYDQDLGVILCVNDENGNRTRYAYDGLGRLTDVYNSYDQLVQSNKHFQGISFEKPVDQSELGGKEFWMWGPLTVIWAADEKAVTQVPLVKIEIRVSDDKGWREIATNIPNSSFGYTFILKRDIFEKTELIDENGIQKLIVSDNCQIRMSGVKGTNVEDPTVVKNYVLITEPFTIKNARTYIRRF